MASKLKQVGTAAAVVLGLLAASAASVGPRIIHLLDSGEEQVDVGKLGGGYRPRSRNLVVSGELASGFAVEKTVTDENGHTKERRGYFPLVSPGWSPPAPVRVVFSARAWAGYRLEELRRSVTQRGVLRDVWWEGLDRDIKEQFELHHVPLAEDVLLIEEREPYDHH